MMEPNYVKEVLQVPDYWCTGPTQAVFYQIPRNPYYHKDLCVDYCHRLLIPDLSKLEAFCSKFKAPPGEDQLAKDFWTFLSSDISPWKKIFQTGKIELVKVDGRPVAWKTEDPNIFKNIPRHFFMNFCIMTRMMAEKTNRIRVWKAFCDIGVDPRESLFLSTYYVLDKDLPVERVMQSHNNAGEHWPITDYPSMSSSMGYFQYNRWMTGDNYEGEAAISSSANRAWSTLEILKKYKSLDRFLPLGETKKASSNRFGDHITYIYDPQKIINALEEWKKQYG